MNELINYFYWSMEAFKTDHLQMKIMMGGLLVHLYIIIWLIRKRK